MTVTRTKKTGNIQRSTLCDLLRYAIPTCARISQDGADPTMFEVLPSGIHGMGLFATHAIPADTIIGILEGTPTDRDGPHVLWLDETRGLRVENDLRFINHADEPNAVYYDDMTVVALVDILPGQEITHDYRGDDEGLEPWDELSEFADLSAATPTPANDPSATPAPTADAPARA